MSIRHARRTASRTKTVRLDESHRYLQVHVTVNEVRARIVDKQLKDHQIRSATRTFKFRIQEFESDSHRLVATLIELEIQTPQFPLKLMNDALAGSSYELIRKNRSKILPVLEVLQERIAEAEASWIWKKENPHA